MLDDGVVMETGLARMVLDFTPKVEDKRIEHQDSNFTKLLAMLDKHIRLSNEKINEVSIKIVTKYEFLGLEKQVDNTWAAVFSPIFWLSRSDFSFESVGYDREDGVFVPMTEITGCVQEKLPIPEIVEIKASQINVFHESVIDRGSIWVIKEDIESLL